jgi:hypothetical protein
VQPNADDLRTRIHTALEREPSLSGTNLALTISDTTIDISGNANTPRQRMTARRIVQSFAGNRKVQERITVAGMPARDEQSQQMQPPTPQNAPAKAEVPSENKTDDRPKSDPKQEGDASGQPR